MQTTSVLAGLALGAVLLAAPLSPRGERLDTVKPVSSWLNTAETNTGGGTGFSTTGFGIHIRQHDPTKDARSVDSERTFRPAQSFL
ncbi:uncharacterized protein PG986_010643 [Apiospora aurea]|uniref:Uncharacterized protein n=1 Tax=Apiospora aurea TaxID=335848 RepID=A0ABR1Q2T6_9PEZI